MNIRSAKVDQLDLPHWTPQEPRAKALKLLHRVGGETANFGRGNTTRCGRSGAPVEQLNGSLRHRLRRIDDFCARVHRLFEERP